MNGLHIVIKGVLHELGLGYFTDISGCCAVEHKAGLVQKERPHYHIWVPPTQKVVEVKRSLREYYDKLKSGLEWNTHANAYYTVKEHDSFESWKSYVLSPETAKCKQPSVALWNAPDRPEVRLLDELILPALVVEKVKTSRTSSTSKLDMWCDHMKAYFEHHPESPVDRNTVLRELIEYSKGGMNKYRVAEWTNTALFRYLESSGEKYKDLKADFCQRLFMEWKDMF